MYSEKTKTGIEDSCPDSVKIWLSAEKAAAPSCGSLAYQL
jgi:hypothetical protein